MATRKYGLSRDEATGHKATTEAVGSATTDAVEVTIDLAKVDKKQDALILLDEIKAYITENIWPPA